MSKPCETCGGPLPLTAHWNRRFCHRRCRPSAVRNRGKRRSRKKVACVLCGFEGNFYSRKFCTGCERRRDRNGQCTQCNRAQIRVLGDAVCAYCDEDLLRGIGWHKTIFLHPTKDLEKVIWSKVEPEGYDAEAGVAIVSARSEAEWSGRSSSEGTLGPRRRVTDEQLVEIRELYATGEWTYQELSDVYNFHKTRIGHWIRQGAEK